MSQPRKYREPTNRQPANGKHFVALLVGVTDLSEVKRYQDEVGEIGVSVKHHWRLAQGHGGTVPDEVDVVLLMRGHMNLIAMRERSAFVHREMTRRVIVDAFSPRKAVEELIKARVFTTPIARPAPVVLAQPAPVVRAQPAPVVLAQPAPVVVAVAQPVVAQPPELPPPPPPPVKEPTQPTQPPSSTPATQPQNERESMDEEQAKAAGLTASQIRNPETAKRALVGKKIRAARVARGWDAAELARRVDVDGFNAASVYNVEYGNTFASPKAAKRIEKLLKLEPGTMPRREGAVERERERERATTTKRRRVARGSEVGARPAPQPPKLMQLAPKAPANDAAAPPEDAVIAFMRIHSMLGALGDVQNVEIKASVGGFNFQVSGDGISVVRSG